MGTGFVTLPMEFFAGILSTQEASVVNHIITSIMDAVEAPFSAHFQTSMNALLTMDCSRHVVQALHSKDTTRIDSERRKKMQVLKGLEVGTSNQTQVLSSDAVDPAMVAPHAAPSVSNSHS